MGLGYLIPQLMSSTCEPIVPRSKRRNRIDSEPGVFLALQSHFTHEPGSRERRVKSPESSILKWTYQSSIIRALTVQNSQRYTSHKSWVCFISKENAEDRRDALQYCDSDASRCITQEQVRLEMRTCIWVAQLVAWNRAGCIAIVPRMRGSILPICQLRVEACKDLACVDLH
jgi:hypothetical protein